MCLKLPCTKKLLGMISRYALNEIAAEYERIPYVGKNPSCCGYVMRTTYSLPCARELSKYVVGSIPLETIHIFWWRWKSYRDDLSSSMFVAKYI